MIPPKSSILIWFGTIINHPFWGPTPIFGNIQILNCLGVLEIPTFFSSYDSRHYKLKLPPENERMTIAGKSTMNEDVFPIEHGDFRMSFVSFQGVYVSQPGFCRIGDPATFSFELFVGCIHTPNDFLSQQTQS